jgi:hypothetical protein
VEASAPRAGWGGVMDKGSAAPEIQQLLDEWRRLAAQFSEIAKRQLEISKRLKALGWPIRLDRPRIPPLRLVRGGRSPREPKGRPGGAA